VILDIIYITLIFIAFFIGLILKKRSSQFAYKVLLLFLLVTFLNETICFFIKIKHLGSTYVFYNAYYYFRFPVLGWIYLSQFSNKLQKSIIYIFFGISLLFFFRNSYLYGFHELHSNYLLTGGFFAISLCLMFFYNILKNSKKKNPLTTAFFWVSTGLFFYFLGILPFFGVINLLLKKEIIFVTEYLVLIKSMSIFLYSLIIFDFYIQWKGSK